MAGRLKDERVSTLHSFSLELVKYLRYLRTPPAVTIAPMTSMTRETTIFNSIRLCKAENEVVVLFRIYFYDRLDPSFHLHRALCRTKCFVLLPKHSAYSVATDRPFDLNNSSIRCPLCRC